MKLVAKSRVLTWLKEFKSKLSSTATNTIIIVPFILFTGWFAWLLGSIGVATGSTNFFTPILIILGIGLLVGLTGGPRN